MACFSTPSYILQHKKFIKHSLLSVYMSQKMNPDVLEWNKQSLQDIY